MVKLVCDTCGFSCEHTRLGLRFAVLWYKSNKTKKTYCKDISPIKTCGGTMESGLTYEQIQSKVEEFKKSHS